MNRISTLLIAVALVACGKADRSTVTPDQAHPQSEASEPAHTDGQPAGKHKHDHDFPAAVGSFHDRMAPLWHAPAGDVRATDTCAAASDLLAGAQGVTTADVPGKVEDPEAWKAAAAALLETTQALQTVCSESPEQFDAAFTTVHDAFHALIELAQPKA